MRINGIYTGLLFLVSALMACTGVDVASDDDSKIAFYVKSAQGVSDSRALIDDTDDLLSRKPTIFVTDELRSGIANKQINYKDNGVWRADDVEWIPNREYSFYAYIASPIQQATDTQGGVYNITNNGKSVTISQPKNYYADSDVWADYLMSYRVSANGTDKPLVRLDMERVTSCVELYMARGANMSEVNVEYIKFENVLTTADFGINYHAVPGDNEGLYGMKNIWTVVPDENSGTTYTYQPSKTLSTYTENRFEPDFLQMRLLVVPQDLVRGVTLSIKYTVDENGNNVSYETSFLLSDYVSTSWVRGHKTRYFIGIDTGIKLEGYVEPWKTVEYIETTLLPKN